MRYSKSERQRRFALVKSFPESGLSRAEFCRRHGLTVNSFNYWLKEMRIQGAESITDAKFVEVQIAENPEFTRISQQADVELELPHGVKLRFFGVGQGGRN